MRLASYNVENLFHRAKVMNLDSWTEGRSTLENFAALNALLGEKNYTETRKRRMVVLMTALGLAASDKGPFVLLRRNRGALLRRPATGGIEIVATGRDDWIGSLELLVEPINHEAIRNTARVFGLIDADVLAVVEAENRPALVNFNERVVADIGGTPFDHVMVIDGNDERGIDVGILSRQAYAIGNMRSHVDDRTTANERIFSRDCPEYEISTPAGNTLVVLVNHLKSKGFGSQSSSNERRRLQAARVRDIFNALSNSGRDLVAVLGDFNDTPDSRPLAPLLEQTTLRDVFTHPAFDNGGFPGTFDNCSASNKLDYILLSPALFARVQAGGVVRQGVWPGVRPKKWPVLDTLTQPIEAASDHAAVWVDLDV